MRKINASDKVGGGWGEGGTKRRQSWYGVKTVEEYIYIII